MPFPPGVSGNPNGRPALTGDLRNIRKISKDELKARVARLLKFTPVEITNILADPATDTLDNILCNILVKASACGDPLRLEWMVRLLIPKEQLEGKEADVEEFKVEYMRHLDRKKLVALVKEGQEEKKNEDV